MITHQRFLGKRPCCVGVAVDECQWHSEPFICAACLRSLAPCCAAPQVTCSAFWCWWCAHSKCLSLSSLQLLHVLLLTMCSFLTNCHKDFVTTRQEGSHGEHLEIAPTTVSSLSMSLTLQPSCTYMLLHLMRRMWNIIAFFKLLIRWLLAVRSGFCSPRSQLELGAVHVACCLAVSSAAGSPGDRTGELERSRACFYFTLSYSL